MTNTPSTSTPATLDELLLVLNNLRQTAGGDAPVFFHRAAAFGPLQVSQRRCPKNGGYRLVTRAGRPCLVFHAH